ncbi:hypothetical protein GLOIN_2v1885896 [Rhizophagus irregularis DAOM 181602=DAOM 197198]|uniref:ATPase AAA-type core domain-containing protein n=1 Tax=Rhizophagus irregularis (strain DAOM 181602 / DAOM 197198 / MUCL 43194) TaxID=747089 RepID=A0A2P4NYY0_RHIID|nr:hypothetical protein GLOIN_2v1885896 [Rhizophagus irregularis DAOM 181602=DAOM 197198]POG58340.1 hypothetical protein GLOIN_2v1885896 [Rhizophagus irregularis DAOM 181602=DAOM 197198]|eukprot:XP_025165206.1 hypothetical protein GLOIN_2v1885896 [Rhizophagus irregularis DAOM 181602=DAOM 197198]
MVESYNCLRLDNSYVFQVEVYKNKNDNDNDDKKFLKIGDEEIPFEKLSLSQIMKLNPNSTEDDIKNLGELEKKRPFTEVEEKANRIVQRAGVYFVDPLELSEPLLNNIRKGEFMTLHGVRATGKTTRVFRVMEQFEEEGYLCLFFSFKRSQVPDSKILFWTTFSDYLVRTAPEHIEDQIKSSNDFVNLFSKRWEKKVILFIDEYDIMYRANNETISSFLRIVRNIKARKEGYAIWSINIVDPSILHLSSKEVTTSPFNVYRPFQNPNFTQEQVQFLFKEYANEERIIINQEACWMALSSIAEKLSMRIKKRTW